jgi:hypothetical protein
MLLIDPQYVARVAAAQAPEDLHDLVQKAIELEHATIPTYLAAWFSLKPGTNAAIAQILRSVVIEEMLHMSIAANLLNAIGGTPQIDVPGFVPSYPGPLPMGIGNGLIVGLERFSARLVADTFMKIEEPEEPLSFPALLAAAPQYATIGKFYQAVLEKLQDLGPGAFKGDPARQLGGTQWFSGMLMPITDLASATQGVNTIVVQGEGTSQTPQDASGDLAHYYRFSQIVEGRCLVQAADGHWAYAGLPVSIDSAGVYPAEANAKSANYPAGSAARNVADIFNTAYSNLLRALHRTFNGEPGHIDVAMGAMYDLRFAAQDVMNTPRPSGGGVCGLPFEYVPA